MLIFPRFETDDAYKKNAYKKKRVMSQFGSAGTSAGAVVTDWEKYWWNKSNSVLYLLDGCPQHRQNGIIEIAPKIMYTKFINEYD